MVPRIAPTTIDYEVNWLMDLPPKTEKLDQGDLDDLICNIMRSSDDNIPEEVDYVEHERGIGGTAWGIATNGVRIYNGLSGEIVDPFSPS